MPAPRPDRTTLAVFVAIVVVAGLNAVAVRFSNHELAPFWGAALRFGLAATVLFGIALARRAALPRGEALVGVLLYGLLGFALSFGAIYWGLVSAPAGAGAVAISLVPLMTLILAPLHGIEPFRPRALVGAVVSVAGIGLVFGEQLTSGIEPAALLALVVGAAAISESTIVVKRYPRSDPAVTNAIGMGVAAVLLFLVSLVAGERLALPADPQTIVAIGYLVLVGSVVVFMGFLYVLARWTASAVSYQLLFMPLVTLPAASFLRGEPVSGIFVVGGLLVFAGVYLGALAPPIQALGRFVPALAPASAPAPGSACIPAVAAAEVPGQVSFVPPSCP